MPQIRIDADADLSSTWELFKAVVEADNNAAALDRLFDAAGIDGEMSIDAAKAHIREAVADGE